MPTQKIDPSLPALLAKAGFTDSLELYEDAFPSSNPIDIFRCVITENLSHITQLDPILIYNALEWTSTLDKGDLLLPVPRLRVRNAPAQQAATWAVAFPPNPLIKAVTSTGKFMRFDFKPEVLPSIVLSSILELGPKYGLNPVKGLRDPQNPSAGKKKIIVEFSSPNIAKDFHAGHLRSTIIGAFLSNLYEGMGWDVVRMNYLGDWGRQYGLLAIGWEKYGNEERFAQNPIGHLYEVYVKISADFKPEDDAYKAANKAGQDTAILETQGLLGRAKNHFKLMEEGDEEALALWRRFRSISIEKYKTTYERLNIRFTNYTGESEVRKETMDAAEKILVDGGYAELDKGALVIKFPKFGAPKLATAIIRNRNGTSNYLLRDVGSAIQRQQDYNPDKMIYVVMSEQDQHLKCLFKTLELMGGEYAALSAKMQHVTYGKVMGMSTRKGNVKILNDILDDVGDAMHEVMKKNEEKYRQVEDPQSVSDTLGISGVMVQDMSGKRVNNYPYDRDRMTSFEGDTGPYLQYAHARLCSIARKTGLTHEELKNADFSLLTEEHATDLVRLMAQYPDTVGQTMKTLEPTTILTYLFRLTHQLSSSYDVLRVVGAAEGQEVMVARAALYESARQVIFNGMKLLGMSPVERM